MGYYILKNAVVHVKKTTLVVVVHWQKMNLYSLELTILCLYILSPMCATIKQHWHRFIHTYVACKVMRALCIQQAHWSLIKLAIIWNYCLYYPTCLPWMCKVCINAVLLYVGKVPVCSKSALSCRMSYGTTTCMVCLYY